MAVWPGGTVTLRSQGYQDIKQISFAVSFCNEKRRDNFHSIKMKYTLLYKNWQACMSLNCKCTFMSSNKSRVQRSARSNRWATDLRSRLPLGHDRVQEKVLHVTINILSKKVLSFQTKFSFKIKWRWNMYNYLSRRFRALETTGRKFGFRRFRKVAKSEC